MRQVLRPWWLSRSTQERRVLAVAALCLGLVLFGWLLQTTLRARQRLLPAVAELQAAALRQGAQADEIRHLRALPVPPTSTTELRQLVQGQVDASGLDRSLVSIESVGTQQVKLAFGSVAFGDWLAWVDVMRAQHLRFVAVRIESRPVPGEVSVTATLERPHR